MIFTRIISSPIGNIKLVTTECKVLKISITDEIVNKDKFNNPKILIKLEKQINEYFNGVRKKFYLNLDFSKFTNLQKQVYTTLAKTKYGSVLSYKELGEKLNCKAYRVIGTFMAKNPFPIIIPCHRVILSNKKSGNYSFGNNKEFFLKHEKNVSKKIIQNKNKHIKKII